MSARSSSLTASRLEPAIAVFIVESRRKPATSSSRRKPSGPVMVTVSPVEIPLSS